MKKATIGILQTGNAPDALARSQGDYDARMKWLLGEDAFKYRTYDVQRNELPASPNEADGWIITGSRHGAYEPHAWIAPLEEFIRAIFASQRPLVGICFGHQVIAQAMGGRVEKADAGWVAGPQTYAFTDGETVTLNAWHQDQVVELPAGAIVVASANGCPAAVVSYPGHALTIQPHPEFVPDYFEGLLAERGSVLPADVIATIAERRSMAVDVDRGCELVREFMSEYARAA